MKQSPLKPLHSQLVELKLNEFRRLSTDQLIESLNPSQPGSLKTRLDGTVLDGHHRLEVLRERGVEVDDLPRVIEYRNLEEEQ